MEPNLDNLNRPRVVVGCAWKLAVAGVCGLLAGPGCSSDPPELRVYAASSLTESFQDLERGFEASHPHQDMRVNLAGSQILRLQIEQGAGADVFASADPIHMRALVDSGVVIQHRPFAHNELALIVPRDNPARIKTFGDLPRATRLVIGTPSVPVGRYTREVLRRTAGPLGADFESKVLARVVSVENNVRLVRAKVELGEADAAIVYRSDAISSEHVRVIQIAPEMNVRAEYSIGVVQGRGNRVAAEAFIAFVFSPEGRALLTRRGFVAD